MMSTQQVINASWPGLCLDIWMSQGWSYCDFSSWLAPLVLNELNCFYDSSFQRNQLSACIQFMHLYSYSFPDFQPNLCLSWISWISCNNCCQPCQLPGVATMCRQILLRVYTFLFPQSLYLISSADLVHPLFLSQRARALNQYCTTVIILVILFSVRGTQGLWMVNGPPGAVAEHPHFPQWVESPFSSFFLLKPSHILEILLAYRSFSPRCRAMAFSEDGSLLAYCDGARYETKKRMFSHAIFPGISVLIAVTFLVSIHWLLPEPLSIKLLGFYFFWQLSTKFLWTFHVMPFESGMPWQISFPLLMCTDDDIHWTSPYLFKMHVFLHLSTVLQLLKLILSR